MKKYLLLFGILVLFSSHELFLKSDSYFLKTGENVELYLYNGTFEESENTITRDRIVNAKILGPDFEFVPVEADYFDKDQETRLRFTTGPAGTYAAGVSTLPRNIELTAEEFKEYLEHEGLDRVINERKNKGISDKSVVEKYSKHVKALLQVGDDTTEDYNTEFGYPIEFLPLQNPYELKIGDLIEFQLILKGEPLANTVVHFGTGASEAQINASITDEDGEFAFEIDKAGQWFVGTIHIVESDDADLDYESNWATLTFEMRK